MSSSNDLQSFSATAKSKARVAKRLYQTRKKPDQILEAAGPFLPPGTTTKAAMAIHAKDEVEDEEEDSGVIIIDDDEEEEDEGEDVNSDGKEEADSDDLQDQIDARDELLVETRTTLQRIARIATKLNKRIRLAFETE